MSAFFNAVFDYFSSSFLLSQCIAQREQSPQHEDMGLPFFLATIIAVIAPTAATATQTMITMLNVSIITPFNEELGMSEELGARSEELGVRS